MSAFDISCTITWPNEQNASLTSQLAITCEIMCSIVVAGRKRQRLIIKHCISPLKNYCFRHVLHIVSQCHSRNRDKSCDTATILHSRFCPLVCKNLIDQKLSVLCKSVFLGPILFSHSRYQRWHSKSPKQNHVNKLWFESQHDGYWWRCPRYFTQWAWFSHVNDAMLTIAPLLPN